MHYALYVERYCMKMQKLEITQKKTWIYFSCIKFVCVCTRVCVVYECVLCVREREMQIIKKNLQYFA